MHFDEQNDAESISRIFMKNNTVTTVQTFYNKKSTNAIQYVQSIIVQTAHKKLHHKYVTRFFKFKYKTFSSSYCPSGNLHYRQINTQPVNINMVFSCNFKCERPAEMAVLKRKSPFQQ